jgi:hypothetical protein
MFPAEEKLKNVPESTWLPKGEIQWRIRKKKQDIKMGPSQKIKL